MFLLTLASQARNLKIFNYLEKDFRLINELFWPRIRKIQSILTYKNVFRVIIKII